MSLTGLPAGITTRTVPVNDLEVFILEASPSNRVADQQLPLVILLHGFPELAYSWRKAIVPLAEAGYHVVAPDQRGYGQTIQKSRPDPSSPISYEEDLLPYTMLNLATDVVSLVFALGYTLSACVIGHDFGSIVAGHCALLRPDVFKKVVMMSAPFTGVPTLDQYNTPDVKSPAQRANDFLIRIPNQPRKHYTIYLSSKEANNDFLHADQGFTTFLRTFYHVKSGSWKGNSASRQIEMHEIVQLPPYYIMPLSKTMPQSVAEYSATSGEEAELTPWLTEEEMNIYATEFQRTGFQGGLNWYRTTTDLHWSKDTRMFSGKKMTVPAMYIGGAGDWGVWQAPGAVEKMRFGLCGGGIMKEGDFVLIENAGHWVQQEQGQAVVDTILRFL